MRWNAKYTKVDVAEKTTRLRRVFAWMPIRIDDTVVWLETYEVLQVFVISEQKANIDGEEINFEVKKWINLANRCK